MSMQKVTCKIVGGLGNQLFQIAATLAYAWKHNKTAVFIYADESESIFQKRPTYWNSFFHNIPTTNSLDFSTYKTYKDPMFSFTPVPLHNSNVLLDGYFQSYKYFDTFRDKLKSTICLPDIEKQIIQKKYHSLLLLKNKVGVHIRRGDYLKLKQFHTVLSNTDYYKKALKAFSKNTSFLIFSDDISWCKKMFKKISTPWPNNMLKKSINKYHEQNSFYFVEDNDITEFFLLSQCEHHILANSSFSWWASYLSPNNGTVVAPKKWFGKKSNVNSTKDLYLPNWMVI